MKSVIVYKHPGTKNTCVCVQQGSLSYLQAHDSLKSLGVFGDEVQIIAVYHVDGVISIW